MTLPNGEYSIDRVSAAEERRCCDGLDLPGKKELVATVH